VSAIEQFEHIARNIYPKFFELLAKKLKISRMQIPKSTGFCQLKLKILAAGDLLRLSKVNGAL
jgi:hypothetical protein